MPDRCERAHAPGTYFLPITTRPLRKGPIAVEVPQTELHRTGLGTGGPSWIMLDDYNRDRLSGSYYIDPYGYMYRFSPAFLAPLRVRFAQLIAAPATYAVARNR